MVGHRRHLDRELETIEAKVVELFGMVCEDLPGVTEALLNGNNEAGRPWPWPSPRPVSAMTDLR